MSKNRLVTSTAKDDEIGEEFEEGSNSSKSRPPVKELQYSDIYEANEVIRQLQEVIESAGLTEGKTADELIKEKPAEVTSALRELITVVMPDGKEYGFIHLVQQLQKLGRAKKPLVLKAKLTDKEAGTYQVTEPVREQER